MGHDARIRHGGRALDADVVGVAGSVYGASCRGLGSEAYQDLAALSAGRRPRRSRRPTGPPSWRWWPANRPLAHWLRLAEEALAGEAAIRENARAAGPGRGTSLAPATVLAVPGAAVHAAPGHIDWAVVAVC